MKTMLRCFSRARSHFSGSSGRHAGPSRFEAESSHCGPPQASTEHLTRALDFQAAGRMHVLSDWRGCPVCAGSAESTPGMTWYGLGWAPRKPPSCTVRFRAGLLVTYTCACALLPRLRIAAVGGEVAQQTAGSGNRMIDYSAHRGRCHLGRLLSNASASSRSG